MTMKKLTIEIDEDTLEAILKEMDVSSDEDQKTIEAEVSEHIMKSFNERK